MTKPVFRFAPSPNGRLHLGHAYSALLNADFARRFDGRLLLRIEDIDTTRCRPEYERAIVEDLEWLGLEWEKPVRRQSEHFADYRSAFQALKGRGLVYPCFCSRKEIAEDVRVFEKRYMESDQSWRTDPDGASLYLGRCRNLSTKEHELRIKKGEPHAWRLDSEAAHELCPGPHNFIRFSLDGDEQIVKANPWRWGDAVIVRKDTPTSYHLSVVVDDALQGVTHVVRGQDLEAATDLHVLLQALLGLPTPLYHHHGLMRDPEGDKLAKSRQSQALAELRAAGATPQDIRQRLGF
jgi:glutamyl-Q tRNA(Asp) synthetase